jgi:hypothetical protein
LGTDAREFPADFPVFVRYTKAIRSLPDATMSWRPLSVTDALSGLTEDSRLTLRGDTQS